MEYRVIGLNINSEVPLKENKSINKSLGLSEKFIKNEFKDSYKKINRNLSLQLQELMNIYGRYGWEHYYQGQVGNLITLYFKRNENFLKSNIQIKLSPEENTILQSLDISQMP